MRKHLHTIMLLFMLALSNQLFAQRYFTEIFSSADSTPNVVYGQDYSVLTGSPVLSNLRMDVYEPAGDTAAMRPLIILMHAGSFLPKDINTLPFGNKSDSCMVEMCQQFA